MVPQKVKKHPKSNHHPEGEAQGFGASWYEASESLGGEHFAPSQRSARHQRGRRIETIQKLPPFDLVIIDEAAQANEPLSWIPMVRGKRAILIGDPCQLAPVIRSQEAVKGLARSLMSRLMP